jgi:isochorismate synthase
MESTPFQNIVIYRLPHQKQLQLFRSGEGNSKFVFSTFLKESKQITMLGQVQSINEEKLESIFSALVLLSSSDYRSSKKEEYIALVDLAKSSIQSGQFDKVVLASKKWVSFDIDVLKIYAELLEKNPNAFVYASFIDGEIMIGASPELLLERDAEQLQTVALGGTETRGVYSEKEKIEHQQIQAYIESVLKENGYNFIKHETNSFNAASVAHLITPYSMKSKGLDNDLDLITQLHPTSAICGLPYQESLDFIKENEGFDRKFYAGYLGAVEANGNFKLFVNLRCAQLYKDGAMLYAGAGINELSSAEDEWAEINNKMQTIAQCLK